jgi:hypothetical protein
MVTPIKEAGRADISNRPLCFIIAAGLLGRARRPRGQKCTEKALACEY